RPLRLRPRLRRWPPRPHDDRPERAADRAPGDHQVADDPKGASAALVAVDPRTGKVLAMIGGNNYRKSQFNLAVQGERQPGSSFKPFVLATALKDGISPDSDFESGP